MSLLSTLKKNPNYLRFFNEMGENDKPFTCTSEGCHMTFTNEDHLTVHRRKHDMVLNLGLACKNIMTADQTPTPTRFIRNCEEVGLFQDLQNVNPFEETFRKAIEHSRDGTIIHISESSNNDSLHTPQILHHVSEKNSGKILLSPDITTIDEHILRIDTHDRKGKDAYLSPIESSTAEGARFCYSTELSTSNEKEYDISSSNSNDTIVEDLSTVKRNMNGFILRSTFSNKCNSKENIKEKIKEVLHKKRKPEVKPLDLKIKDDALKKPRQRINLKTKLKTIMGMEADILKLDYKKHANLYDKNLNDVEKRRAMNRVAQMRSRKRKKMWLDQMEQEIEKLKADNKIILMENQKLKEENIVLKSMLLKHNDCLQSEAYSQHGKLYASEKKLVPVTTIPILCNPFTMESPHNLKIGESVPAIKISNVQYRQTPLPKLLPKNTSQDRDCDESND